MTPGKYIALIRDAVIVGGILLVLWLVYRGGQDHVKAADLKGLQKQITQQGQQIEVWHKENTDANIQFEKTMAAINAAPVVIHDWVRNDTCPKQPVLSTPASEASSGSATVRPVQPGDGGVSAGDWRDRVTAEYKARWERILAQCRAEDAQWPQ